MNDILKDTWLSWHSYPKITALGHKDTANIFVGNYQVQEKIDGSQISFGKFKGELRIKGRSADVNLDHPEKMFGLAVEVIKSIEPLLHEGWVYRGEYLKTPKHNTLEYSRVPKNHIMIFDISDGLQSFLNPYEDRDAEAERIGFESVYTTRWDRPMTTEMLVAYMGRESSLGDCKVEGYVFKNYEQRLFGMPLFAKYVSDEFKEVHNQEWKKSNPAKRDVVVALTESLKTNARWEKAVQHLRENGKLTESPKDIGAIMKEVQDDVKLECYDMITQHLWSWAWPHIQRGIVSGMPEWYKDKISENILGRKNQDE